jgi:hypothetical protein
MDTVGEAGAVNKDIGSGLPGCGKFEILSEKTSLGVFITNGCKKVTDPLA